MTWREISCDQFNGLKRATLIDVRSPCEYQVERIPGSINIPLFSDEERELIGTVYARQGELVARRRAMDIISPKIPALIDQILAAREGNNAPLVIHCWRGGLRSEAVASCLSIVGVDCWRLTGGYKAWRKIVLRDFEADKYRFRFIALQGHTGSGKTEILKCLTERGAKVIDLEAAANHRGSVFGALGLGAQPSQKDFEAALWQKFREFEEYDGLLFVEAEGKAIGRLRLPETVYRRITAAPQILVNGSMHARCHRIAAEYTGLENNLQPADSSMERHKEAGLAGASVALMQTALQSLDAIKERVQGPILNEIKDKVADNNLLKAVELLLVHYYDKYYSRYIENCSFAFTVDGDNPEQAASDILSKCETIFAPETVD